MQVPEVAAANIPCLLFVSLLSLEMSDIKSLSLCQTQIELSCYNTEFGFKSTLLFAVIQFQNGYLLQVLHLVSKYFFHLVSKYFDTWRSHISH